MNGSLEIKKNQMVNNFSLFVILVFLFVSLSTNGQGLLLRGEKWQKFSVEDKIADFYVSPDGNDSWSGTLAYANSRKSNGPLKTIQKAK